MNATLTYPSRSNSPQIWRPLFGMLASVVLLSSGTSAFAGAGEFTALNEKLGGSKLVNKVATATSAELASAVLFFTNPVNNPKKLNPGAIAGEALKGAGSNALDAGTQIAAAVSGAFPITYGTKTLDKTQFATFAIKTTGTGKGATVAQVPALTVGLFNSTEAVSLAILVKGTKGAAGAVIQGGASQLASDALKSTYANDRLAAKDFSAVVQDVAKGVAATVADPIAFTNALVSAPANAKILLKIIPGIVAGKPTNAGAITNAALTNPTYSTLGAKSPIIAGAATLAKTVGAVADIEQIQKVGAAIAAQIPIVTTIAGKPVPNIKLSKASSIVATLAKAIAAKPFASLLGGKGTDPALATADAALVKNSEKADELGELAAYFINAIIPSAELTSSKDPGKIIAGLLKAVIGGGKLGDKTTKPTKDDIAKYTALMAQYVAGSVALTVSNLPAGALKTSITAALTKAGFAKGLAGASNEASITAAINLGLTGVTGGRFENGFDVVTGALTDPETNSRNF